MLTTILTWIAYIGVACIVFGAILSLQYWYRAKRMKLPKRFWKDIDTFLAKEREKGDGLGV